MRADRVDARYVIAAAEPFGAFRPLPQALDQLPAGTEVAAAQIWTSFQGTPAAPSG
jgi:hypothetical protein